MRESGKFELVELDPATGEEDHLVETGSFRRMVREMEELLAEAAEDWDERGAAWPAYRVQPAQ